MVSFMRTMFGEHVLNHPMLKKHGRIRCGNHQADALRSQRRDQFHRNTYDRAMEALVSINGEIAQLIETAWGRK